MNYISRIFLNLRHKKHFTSVWGIILLGLIIPADWSSTSRAAAPVYEDDSKIVIVDQSGAKAVIVVTDDATDQVKAAADELSKYIRLSTNADVKIKKYSEMKIDQGDVRIIIKTGKLRNDELVNPFVNTDEYSISFPDKRTITINGATDWGTEFGIYEFLERYVGVRWLMPGPDGAFVPSTNKLSVPILDVRGNPAFMSRLLSGLKGLEQYLWARHNRMHGQIKFHHNLFNLFPPAIYTKTHPEFFPMIEGKRYLPKDGTEHAWQPCFSAPGIVEEAVKNICHYFAKHPEESSYSLGVNDSGGHCECDICRAKSSDVKNFLGLRNMSDLYFEWANAVTEGVLKQYPDKWFGCLAYSEVAAPPLKIKVHPRIIPFMTYDRMRWIMPAYENEGKKLTEQWLRKASVMGWYDYIYGTPYLVPRVYFHKMADYYRYGYEHGVRAMYAEAYPNWGEGPKLHVAMKLQWDTDLNVDKLLSDWYEKCVGGEAAPYLKAYYDLWESFWTKKAPESKWFSAGGQYLWFHDAGYVDLVDEEITRSRDLLQMVVSKAASVDQKKRANLILRAFEYYEASVLSYKEKGKCSGLAVLSIGHDCDLYKKMKEKRFSLVNEFENDPVLIHPLRFDKRNILQW